MRESIPQPARTPAIPDRTSVHSGPRPSGRCDRDHPHAVDAWEAARQHRVEPDRIPYYPVAERRAGDDQPILSAELVDTGIDLRSNLVPRVELAVGGEEVRVEARLCPLARILRVERELLDRGDLGIEERAPDEARHVVVESRF